MSEDIDLNLVADRLEFLEYLTGNSQHKPAIVEELGHSRSTVDRAIRALENDGLVERTGDGFSTTLTGRLAAEQYRRTLSVSAEIVAADRALEPLPATATLDPAIVADAEVSLSEGPLDETALSRIEDLVSRADRLYGALPTVSDRALLDTYHSAITETPLRAELVLDPDLWAAFESHFGAELDAMVDEHGLRVLRGDTPAFGLLLVETASETVVVVIVYDGRGSIHAVLTAGTSAAVQWAKNVYREHRDAATRVIGVDGTESSTMVTLPDMGRDRSPTSRDGGSTAGTRPSTADHTIAERHRLQLAAEGIQLVDRRYFERRSASAPITSWRTGFTLSDVEAGHALRRERPTEDREQLATLLVGGLRDGRDHALLGPAGSGKSVTAKTVAVDWYDRGYGPVFYRESGTARPYESVSLLEETLRSIEGHALVVVEDAVRDEGNTVFEVMETLRDDPHVSFLVDARTSEWEDPDDFPVDARVASYRQTAVETVSMPELDRRETERFVTHFERIVDRTVEGSPDDLYASITDDDGSPEQPAAVMLLVHRLSVLADPLTVSELAVPTSLVESIATTYQHFRESSNDLVLDLAVVINLLNLAGIAPRQEYVYAVALATGNGDVTGALAELRRHDVLQEIDDPAATATDQYRTVHEAWSRLFLKEIIDREGPGSVHDRLDRCLSAVLRLADDESFRADVEWQVAGDTSQLDRIRDDPTGWVDSFAVQVFESGSRLPPIVRAFGDPEVVGVTLPDACRWETRAECLLAQTVNVQGFGERAYRSASRVREIARQHREADPETAAEYEARALIRMAHSRYTTATSDGEKSFMERKNELAGEALEIAEEHGLERLAARARRGITAGGKATRDDIDQLQAALAELREVGDERERLETLQILLRKEFIHHDGEAVEDHLREALQVADRIGAKTHRAEILGNVALLCSRILSLTTPGPLGHGVGTESDDWMDMLGHLARGCGYSPDEHATATTFVDRLATDLVEAARELDLQVQQLVGYYVKGVVACIDDEAEAARTCASRCEQLLERVDVSYQYRSLPLIGIVTMAIRTNDWSRAKTFFPETIDALEAAQIPAERGPWTQAAQLATELGDRNVGKRAYERATDTDIEVHPNPDALLAVERLVALATEYDDAETARTYYDILKESAEKAGLDAKVTALEANRDRLLSGAVLDD